MALETRLEELTSQLEEANNSLEDVISKDLSEELSDHIEYYINKINDLTKEMSSIINAINL